MLARRTPLSALVVTLVLAALATAGASAATARTRAPAPVTPVPQGFVGMNADGPLFDSHVDFAHQMDTMVSAGVESIRVTFNWSTAQPYPSFKALSAAGADPSDYDNVGGVPTSFDAIDQVVEDAASRGIQVMPVVIYAPGWDAAPHPPYEFARPARSAPYVNFLQALVRRYGPNGTIWRANPGIPKLTIRMWQIWNEPVIPSFWPDRPFEKTYVALLHAAHAGIKSVDPGAEVVLAGLPNYSWYYLASLYRTPGFRGSFEVVAVHPYTAKPTGVITILGLVRNVMNRYGDSRKPILATEVGWPSSSGKALQSFGTTEAVQASDTAALLPLLGAHRRQLNLLGFDYFDWIGGERKGFSAFDYSGLFRINTDTGKIVAKPAFAAFRKGALALEGCLVKGATANRCARAVRARTG